MKRPDALFLVAVIVAAGLFAAASIDRARDILGPGAGAAEFRPTSAGIPRDVDLDKIKRLMDQHHLSPHEAQFYRKVSPPPEAPPKAPVK